MHTKILLVILLSISCVQKNHATNLIVNKDTLSITDSTMTSRSPLQFSGYADVHYSMDFNYPSDHIRKFNSSPMHVNQFDIGYAYMQGVYEKDRIKATIAFHYGSIVELMYASEPVLLKPIREISVRYKFTKKLFMEAGVMPAFFGMETFINKNNMFAARAVMTDFAPDFALGARLGYHINKNFYAKVELSNGWQTLRETNNNKALSALLHYNKPNKLTLNWGFMRTNEQPQDSVRRMRYYNNIYAKIHLGKWVLAPMLDIAFQQSKRHAGYDHWISSGMVVRYQCSSKYAVGVRGEYIYDPNQILPDWRTGTPNGYQMKDITLSFEHTPSSIITFRVEGRYSHSKDPIYTRYTNELSRQDLYWMASVAVAF